MEPVSWPDLFVFKIFCVCLDRLCSELIRIRLWSVLHRNLSLPVLDRIHLIVRSFQRHVVVLFRLLGLPVECHRLQFVGINLLPFLFKRFFREQNSPMNQLGYNSDLAISVLLVFLCPSLCPSGFCLSLFPSDLSWLLFFYKFRLDWLCYWFTYCTSDYSFQVVLSKRICFSHFRTQSSADVVFL